MRVANNIIIDAVTVMRLARVTLSYKQVTINLFYEDYSRLNSKHVLIMLSLLQFNFVMLPMHETWSSFNPIHKSSYTKVDLIP